MEAYETCVSSLRKTQAQRRNMSLNRISPANFTKEVMIVFLQMVTITISMSPYILWENENVKVKFHQNCNILH